MTADPEKLARELREAAGDPAQDEAARVALDALGVGFESLAVAMQTGRTWFHLHGITSDERPEVRDGHFLALSLLAGTAGALTTGAATLIGVGNLYGAAALTRQIVEDEYLAWAFENDPAEVVDWYSSTKEARLARWQPRHLRKRSGGKFRGMDYGLHCEIGGHPTPDGMRRLLHDDVVIQTGLGRFEILSHGFSAWRYALAAVRALCERYKVDPERVLPAHVEVVESAYWEWSGTQKISDAWESFKAERDS